MKGHKERVYGDTTECAICGKQWDTNDPYPPNCLTKQQVGLKWLKKIRVKLNLQSVK